MDSLAKQILPYALVLACLAGCADQRRDEVLRPEYERPVAPPIAAKPLDASPLPTPVPTTGPAPSPVVAPAPRPLRTEAPEDPQSPIVSRFASNRSGGSTVEPAVRIDARAGEMVEVITPATLPATYVAQVAPAVRTPSGGTTLPAAAPAASEPAVTDYHVLGSSEVVAASLLQVNDKFITLQQVLHPVRQQLQRLGKSLKTEGEFRQQGSDMIDHEVRNQIEQMLLFGEADKRLSDEEKKVVQEELDEQARRIVAQIGSRAQFARELAQEGTDLTTWTEDMKRALTIEAFIHRRFSRRVDVDGRTMLKFYREHRDRWQKKERVRMQVIAAPFDSFLDPRAARDEAARREAVAKAHEQIAQAKAELDKGEGFDAVAKKYDRGPMAAQGGLWPLMERGSFRSGQVEDVAFKQGVGAVSDIIDTSQGYYIVKTIQLEPATEQTFDKVQTEIEAELRKAQYQTLTSDYLKELQTKTRIFVPPGVEKLAVDAAVRLYWVPPESRQ